MPIQHPVTSEHGVVTQSVLDEHPDTCPICGKSGQPEFSTGCINTNTGSLHAAFRCPITKCRGLYIGVYRCNRFSGGIWHGALTRTMLARLTEGIAFHKNITDISPLFGEIFNQAHIAEENGLKHICGPGYRKALEFLIKDFLILHKFKGDAAKKEELQTLFLGVVIQKFVEDDRIKQCAKRAAWLGNDETHYTRRWQDKDLEDLKSLILLTVNFTDSSIEADRYLKDMTDSKAT